MSSKNQLKWLHGSHLGSACLFKSTLTHKLVSSS